MRNRTGRGSGLNTPGGMLIRLKNKILATLRIDPTRLNLLLEKYSIKLNGGRKDHKSQATKTNLSAAINRDYISINKFFGFLMILEPKNVKISVTITLKNGEEYTVDETAIFRTEEPAIITDEEETDENEK